MKVTKKGKHEGLKRLQLVFRGVFHRVIKGIFMIKFESWQQRPRKRPLLVSYRTDSMHEKEQVRG